ncbi:MAG TPA: type II secretion system protein GspC [Steroidobacteraceae bacterium]|nr:type II secretion system protein GspC [Steroidobacteraceae bacterium]
MQLPKSLSRISALAENARAEGWEKSLPLLATAALTVLLAWQLVHLAWVAMGVRKAPVVAGPRHGGFSAAPSAAPVNVGAIVSAHLFGEAHPTGPVDPNSVAASQASLVLAGTIAYSDPALGYAIIGDSPMNAKVYAVGKTLAGGGKLHSVYLDRVIIERNGNLEALLLPKKFTGTGLVQAAGPGGLPPVSGAMGFRAAVAANPAAITEIIRPQPVFANGQQRGYRVYPGRNRGQFLKLGLLPGDLVTAVNGTPLDDPNRGVEILQSMDSAASVTVTVERNGQTQQVTINNTQTAPEAGAAPEPVPVSEMRPAMKNAEPSE